MAKNARLVFALVLFCVFSGAIAGEKKPNLIFILIDDQGYYDLGCYGGTEFDTPRIDRMAREGIRFTDYYAAAPICSPSRAGILTGCYPRRVGLETWVQRADSRKGIHPDELTLADLLKSPASANGTWAFCRRFCRDNRDSITTSACCTISIRWRSSISSRPGECR